MSELDRPHYQLLLGIDRHGSISRAADGLFISQSAASQRLREAERRLGYRLTERSGRSVVLTEAAARLVEAAATSEAALTAAEADARWLASSGEPSVRLALDVHDGWEWIPGLAAELDRTEGLRPLEIVRANDALGAVTTGDASAAIVPGAPRGASAVPLFDDELVGVVAAADELAGRDALEPADFAGRDYVTYSTTPRRGFEHDTFFAPHQVWPERIRRIESVRLVVDLVATGAWLTILPAWEVPLDRTDLVVLPLRPPAGTVTWHLALHAAVDPDEDLTITAMVAYLRDREPTVVN